MLINCAFNYFDPEIKKMYESKGYPKYATTHSAGLDILASEDVTIYPGEIKKISTGLALSVDKKQRHNIAINMYIKSGKALKLGLGLVNSVGVIDADYVNEIKAIVINMSSEPVKIEKGESYFQLVVNPVVRLQKAVMDRTFNLKPVFDSSLETKTERTGGFGSTDKNEESYE